jgi:hypothetical protein
MQVNKDLSLSQGPYLLSISTTYRISYHLNEPIKIKVKLSLYLIKINVFFRSWDKALSIATGYGLDGRCVGVRVPVGSSSLRADQLLGPPTASSPMGTGIKRPGV